MANLERLKFLQQTVIPFLEDMPTIDEIADTSISYYGESADFELEYNCDWTIKQGKSLLNFNSYRDNNTPIGFDLLPISKKYECSREGCLAGWYVFMKEANDPEDDLSKIKCYSIMRLAQHFGIPTGQAMMLFGSLTQGAEGMPDDLPQEDTVWTKSQVDFTRDALEARARYLNRLIADVELDAELEPDSIAPI